MFYLLSSTIHSQVEVAFDNTMRGSKTPIWLQIQLKQDYLTQTRNTITLDNHSKQL